MKFIAAKERVQLGHLTKDKVEPKGKELEIALYSPKNVGHDNSLEPTLILVVRINVGTFVLNPH
jgi:hypothetical protein